MLSPSSQILLREVAQVLMDAPFRQGTEHLPRQQRRAQLRELGARFKAQHGYYPSRAELARMAGLSKSAVTQALGVAK